MIVSYFSCGKPKAEDCAVPHCGRTAVARCDFPLLTGKPCGKPLCSGHRRKHREGKDLCPTHDRLLLQLESGDA